MKTLLVSILLLIAGSARSQDDSVPGRSQATNDPSVMVGISVGAQPQFRPELMPVTQSATAIAEAITPDIQSLADNLQGDPALIFNYVHDQIRYVHYFGSKKGAELTLLERSGNDFDQCALLAALLQASGYATEYQFGWMKIPYDNPTNQLDFHHWLCLTLNNTNSTYTGQYIAHLSGARGFYEIYNFGSSDTNDFLIQHLVVCTTIGGTNYYLDPSFKVSAPITGTSLATAIGVNSNTLWTAAGGTDTGTYAGALTEGALRASLQSGNTNLLGYISDNIPNATPAQIIGGQQIVSSSGLPLSTSLNYAFYTNAGQGIITVNWTNQPTNFMGTFTMSFAGTNQTWLTPQFQGQRLSLIFETNGTAQIWQQDSLLLQTTNTGTSNTLQVIMTATHTYGGWNTTSNTPHDTGVDDYSFTNNYQRTNATYAIMYAFEANQAWLKERQQMLNMYIQQGLASTSREVTTETLNVMGLGWMVQTELAEDLLSQESGLLPQNHHRFGRMAQEAGRGYYVDVYLQLDGTFPATGYNSQDIATENQVFDVSSYFWSAMEHGIIEQLQNSNLVAASTVKMIEVANTNSTDVYLANSDNWTTVRSGLVNYGSTTNTLSSLVSSGFTLLLPQNGSNFVNGTSGWAGYGYVQLGVLANGARSMGMIISGAYNGGYVNNSTATINPPFVNQTSENQPTFFNPQAATLSIPPQLGADPINMVDGTFQISSTDLAVGQSEPRGLNLVRYYSSERINSNPTGMAPGWLHSYYCNATAISDPEGGLGTETVEQMSPMIVATYSALSLYNNIIPDPKNWVTTALIAKWGIDQLINNAVTINLGSSTIEFTRQPEGSYTPPPNSTMSLVSTNGAYWLQERHGRTFKFNTNSVLTNIVDQYGQSMNLSYNTNNLVSTVTDWVNRSLTFTYTAGVLTSVSDSSGRSVSYAYTNGELTAYTDPQQKTTTYAYDATNELVATFDALGSLVESNYYDGLGHVTSQITEGNTNKTWQVRAAGYYTTVLDPAGDEQIYTYDNLSRPIAFQDGMGNITQTVYDGQNHVVQTISPLNEISQFFYDSGNNLIETIDPLGYSNVFNFDANNNLIASRDARGNTNYFGYNNEFSPTGVTNGSGDWFVLAYNSNGTLYSRQDAGGTTTYGYDAYGTLNSITYPSSLGGESFVNSVLGDATSHTDGNGNTTTFSYNNRRQLTNTVAPTNLTASASFDANANLSTVTDPRRYVTSNSWSTTRKLLTTAMPLTSQGTPVVTRVYDNRDWLAQARNPLGNSAYYTNDAAHRLIANTDPLQRTTAFSYDDDGRELTSTDAALDQTTQTWNSRGNLVQVVDPATNTVKRAYDGAGNLIFLTNRDTKVWQFQYDGANRLTMSISPLNHASSQIYNNRGLLQSRTDPLLQTTSFTYDARGRLATKADTLGTIDYQFDANNNLISLTNSGTGSRLSWGYDAYNRPSSFTNVIPPSLHSLNMSYGIQYRHDANGNLTGIIYPASPVYPGNLTVNYYYDNNNRLTNVTDWNGMQTTFTYDLAGHLTGVYSPNGTVRLMAYDAAGELTNIVEKTAAQFPIAFQTLSYNRAGRVQWEFKGPLPHSNSVPARTMTFDNDNRLATFNGTNATVDADGNLTYGPLANGTFGAYTYDARNELTSAGGSSYGYDPAGNRISVTSGGETTSYMIDPQTSRVLMRFKTIPSGSYVTYVTTYYVYGPGLLYEINVTLATDGYIVNGEVECPCEILQWTTNTAFYHYDCRGSTIALTDGNGNPTDLIEYSSYGTTTYRYGTNTTPFLYNGRFGVQTDPNGLLYMRARYYNPYVSRFINADPSGFGGGLNFYLFCNDNPISNEDPFGLQIPTPANFVMGMANYNWPVVSDAAWYNQFQAVNQQALAIESTVAGGAVVGAAGAAVGGAGAVGLVALGVPQSVVTGGLLVTGSAGFVASGYSIYNKPSVDNIAFNAGGFGGGLLVGGASANYVASALSPSGYQPSGAVSLSSDVAMAWTGANGNINPLAFLSAWLLPGSGVAPMSTGPSALGAAGTVGGAGAGVAGGFSLFLGNTQSQSSTGK